MCAECVYQQAWSQPSLMWSSVSTPYQQHFVVPASLSVLCVCTTSQSDSQQSPRYTCTLSHGLPLLNKSNTPRVSGPASASCPGVTGQQPFFLYRPREKLVISSYLLEFVLFTRLSSINNFIVAPQTNPNRGKWWIQGLIPTRRTCTFSWMNQDANIARHYLAVFPHMAGTNWTIKHSCVCLCSSRNWIVIRKNSRTIILHLHTTLWQLKLFLFLWSWNK